MLVEFDLQETVFFYLSHVYTVSQNEMGKYIERNITVIHH
jgi:hypothetical protein